jgi:heavy metal translocating P-type ATPase
MPTAHAVVLVVLALLGAPLVWRTIRDAMRGHFATDIVASLAIVGAIVMNEPWAGLVVVLMQRGGEALERRAERRASAAVDALEAAAPRIAHRLASDPAGNGTGSAPIDIPVGQVAVGDLLRVRPGELVPVDAAIVEGRSTVDISAMTGESNPLAAGPGTHVPSGGVNGQGALVIRALATAGESQYARIVQLVRSAQAQKAPLQRLADRYAVWFTPLTLLVCAAAWLASGDATRVLAVLVVATPCPLILATPIAVIGGINRAARRHVMLRHGGALEQLASIDTVVLDKTGTLTLGRPEVEHIRTTGALDEPTLLRLAGAIEEHASHPLARPVVNAAVARFGTLPAATDSIEEFGRGVEGLVDGHRVAVGAPSWIASRYAPASDRAITGAPLSAWVGVDGKVAGVISYIDSLRPDAADFVRALPALGVTRVLLLSGDAPENAMRAAESLGITEAWGGLLPEEKAARIEALVRGGARVAMIGDGVNDAPALAAATVGIALAGASGRGGVTADSADVVVLGDELAAVTDTIRLSQRAIHIARQSIRVGLGLSGVGMLAAAMGWLPPIAGAVAQEAIDVAVILNALRASVAGGSGWSDDGN